MKTSLVDASSVLALDIGSVHTRAILFDVVDGQYRFIASGLAPSTHYGPYFDVNEGIYQAAMQLQEITGRDIFVDGRLVMPCQPDGSGIDQLVMTVSAGPELHLVTTGLLPDVSLESAQRLATSTSGRLCEAIGLTDRRQTETQLDAILRIRPDVIILAGGTDQGASRSVTKIVEMIGLICRVLPAEKRPEVIYAGNRALAKRVKEYLGKLTTVHEAANVRPTIDEEDLTPAQDALAHAVANLRIRQLVGLESISALSVTPLTPTSHAFGRLIRFLSQVHDPAKGVLGVDLGGSTTTIAAATAGQLALNVFNIGVGPGVRQAIEVIKPDDILQWMPVHSSVETIRDYLWAKVLYPNLLPATAETLAIERSLVRQVLRLTMQRTLERWPDINPAWEPLVISGLTLARTQTPGQALLMVLDGLQPVGVTTIILDQNGISASLGAIAATNALLPVQVLESSAYLNLGTVISPVSEARYGTPILKVHIVQESGNEVRAEIKQGSLVSLPIRNGQTAQIYLTPLHGTVIDPAAVSRSGFKVTGGACGVLIDARGRPLVLPPETSRRREMLKKWSLALGG